MDKRVALLNYTLLREDRAWSDPYLLSKFIRHFGVSTKKCALRVKRCLLNFSPFFLRTGTRSSQEGQRLGDIELGENSTPEAADKTQDGLPLETQAEKVKNRYCDSLRRRFGEGDLVQIFMNVTDNWKNG